MLGVERGTWAKPRGATVGPQAGAQRWPWCEEQPRWRWVVKVTDRQQRYAEGCGSVHGPHFSPQLIPKEKGLPICLSASPCKQCHPRIDSFRHSVSQSFYIRQLTEQLLHTGHRVRMDVSPVAMGIPWEADPRLKFTRGDPAVGPAGAPQTFRCGLGGRGGERGRGIIHTPGF